MLARLALGAALWLPASPASAVPILFLDIDGQGSVATLSPGQSVSVTAWASGIPVGTDGKGLFGFGFAALFDVTKLSATTPAVGPLWTGPTLTRGDPGDVGATSVLFGSPSGPFGDDILLASFTLTALQSGSHTLALLHFLGEGDNVLFDGTELDGAGSGFFLDARVHVTPEPGVGCLVLFGLTALGSTRRSRYHP